MDVTANDIIAALEQQRNLLSNQLAQAQATITAMARKISELEAAKPVEAKAA